MGEFLGPQTTIRCERLRASLPAAVCVLRQRITDRQRTQDSWRGIAATFPTCVTAQCAHGRAVREALEEQVPRVRSGLDGGKLAAQLAARRRLRVIGLLDERPTLDEPPSEECGGVP